MLYNCLFDFSLVSVEMESLFISVSVDENASTGEQAGRERSGSTSGDELAALSHAHRKRGPTEGQKTVSEVQSERDIKVPGHCLVHNCFFSSSFLSGCITFLCLQVTCLCFYLKGVSLQEPKVRDSLYWRKQKTQNLLPILFFVLCINNGQVEEDKTRKISGGDHKGTHQQQCCVSALRMLNGQTILLYQ